MFPLRTLCAALIAMTSLAIAHAAADSVAELDSIVPFENAKVHYRSIGVGQNALVFIHGWACNLDFWETTLRSLPEYRVIAIDLPGHGASDKPRVTYSMDYFSGSVDAVLKDANLARAVLVGHSMGARISYSFYKKHPEKVLGLVLVDGMPWTSRNRKRSDLDLLIKSYRKNYSATFDSALGSLLQGMTDDSLARRIREQMKTTPEHVSLSAAESMIRDDMIGTTDQEGRIVILPGSGAEISVPTLVILSGGAREGASWWPDDTENFLRHRIADLDYQRWRNVSHFLMLEEPIAFNASLSRFLRHIFLRESDGS